MISTSDSRKVDMALKMMPSYSSVSYTESSSVTSDLKKDLKESNALNMSMNLSETSHKKSKYIAVWT